MLILHRFDGLGRNSGVALEDGSYEVGYTYMPDGRFYSVTSAVDGISSTHTYDYVYGSRMIEHVYHDQLTRTTRYDPYRMVITDVDNRIVSSGQYASRFDYQNDKLRRRTQRTQSGTQSGVSFPVADTIDYGYNLRSEVTSAVSDTDTDYDYGYQYDPIGNRLVASGVSGGSLETNTYSAISNSVSSVISVVNPSYDLDGSLTNNPPWCYTYDGENRLCFSSNTVTGVTIEYECDHLGRRRYRYCEAEADWRYYIYDGVTSDLSLCRFADWVYAFPARSAGGGLIW